MDFKNIDWKNLLFTFDGRVSQRVFITYFIAVFVLGILISILVAILGQTLGQIVSLILYIPITIATYAIAIKRFHDMGKVGWFSLLYLVPLVNLGVLIWQGITKSDGPNQYGAMTTTI